MSSTTAPTTICVFCGSSPGASPAYTEAARALAHVFHKNGIRMVYGGGSWGLMGEVARTLVSLSGPDAVHGIIPRAMMAQERTGHFSQGWAEAASGETAAKPAPEPSTADIKVPDELAYGRTTIVSSMHERKAMMTQAVLAGGPGSGFVALPGGFGTLEELAEVTTWNQIGIHGAGIVVFDVEGFWQPLVQWIQHSTKQGFISEKNSHIIASAPDAEGCVRELREYKVSEARARLDWT